MSILRFGLTVFAINTPAAIPSPTDVECKLLRELIENESGIVVTYDKAYLLETRLESMLRQQQCASYTEFHQKLQSQQNKDLLNAVIDQMTTNETLWFRDSGPFETFKNQILPALAEKSQKMELLKPIRIWSAACSTGQEPYSLAMIIDEFCKNNLSYGLRSTDFVIIGTDICSNAIKKAQAGLYDGFAISRGLPDSYKQKYFTEQENNKWQISSEIMKMVQIQHFNLKNDYANLGRFDAVFLRNVLIYFSDKFKADIIHRISLNLRPQGVLFVGATEIISAAAQDYTMETSDKSIFYRLK